MESRVLNDQSGAAPEKMGPGKLQRSSSQLLPCPSMPLLFQITVVAPLVSKYAHAQLSNSPGLLLIPTPSQNPPLSLLRPLLVLLPASVEASYTLPAAVKSAPDAAVNGSAVNAAAAEDPLQPSVPPHDGIKEKGCVFLLILPLPHHNLRQPL